MVDRNMTPNSAGCVNKELFANTLAKETLYRTEVKLGLPGQVPNVEKSPKPRNHTEISRKLLKIQSGNSLTDQYVLWLCFQVANIRTQQLEK